MTERARRDGRRWSAVLVVSVLALVVSGGFLLSDHRAAAQLPSEEQLADVPAAGTSTSPSASPSAAPTEKRAAASPRGWGTRDARPPKVQRKAVPETLIIPDVDVEIPVQPTGVDEHGSMALPERPDRAGWYAYGPAPGDPSGSAVIAAHVDSERYGIGPLASLAALRDGDRVRVEGARRVEFRVVAVQRISKKSLDTDKLFARSGDPVLRLVTCGGRFDPKDGYEDNVVVTAVPVRG